MKKFAIVLSLLLNVISYGQVKGTITDTNGEPLSFVSVYLENSLTGTTSNDLGYFELEINKTGKHIIVFQYLGYTTLKKEVFIERFPFTLNIKLNEENIKLEEIIISTKDNPADIIIKKTIESKENNTDKFPEYTARFYSRGLFRIKNAPKKILGQDLGDFGGGLDSTRTGIIYLSETISKIAFQKKPKNFKEIIIASKVSGSDNGISFNRAEEANFNFYENGVTVGENNLISPIANGAFRYYRYKLVGTFYDKNGVLINKISVIPKREADRVFRGFIYIVEDDWAIYGVDLITSGKQIGIPFVGELRFKQDYNFSTQNSAWVLISQSIDFGFGFFGFNVNGRFSSAYSDYNFNPNFKETFFTNEVLSFEKDATKKDSFYWSQLRPVPLTTEEVKDYKVKDSIKEFRESKKFLDSIDGKNNKFKLLSPITGYSYRNSYEKWSLNFDSPLENIAYNTVQGWNFNTGINYFKQLNDKGKWINTGININYGVSDQELRPVIYYSKKWNNITRNRLSISAGITTPQFNNRNPISRINNTIYSLLREENYLKIYEKTFAQISYSQEVTNGVYVNGSLEYANRKPLFNTTDYVLIGSDRVFESNNPLDPTNFSAPFISHTIWSFNVGANIVFDQKYLMYPDSKIPIGNSTYPNLYLGYRKNFGASNTNFNSDLFFARLSQNLTAGNFGNLSYNIRSGIFLEQKQIPFMDYLHANGNQLNFLPENTINSFGLLDYYALSTNDKYAEFHLQHNFKGAVLGKIPLINKLNFHLVGGAKALYSGQNKPYTEYSVGLDNIGFGKWRFLRIDYVQSSFNGLKNNALLFGVTIGN